jgi:hypothetical protein
MQWLLHILQGMFLVGVVGCGLTIPIVAFKFFSVLFEKDEEERPNQEFEHLPQR